VAGILDVEREALVRSINAWKKAELVDYTPPKRGTEIRILKRENREDVKVDFTAMREKATRAYKKLEEMEEYVFSFGCRPQYIMSYFGEEDAVPCGQCDNCLNGGKLKSQNEKFYNDKKDVDSPPWRGAPKGRGGFTKWEKTPKADFDNIKVEKKTLSTKLTQLETLDLYLKGRSILEIAKEREIQENTVYNHLEFLIEKGLIKDIDKLVDSKKQEKIFAVIKKVGTDKLTPIREELGEEYSWEEIKIARAKFKSHKK
jgi:ATP-dependent DNA helicase RecQ